MLTSAEQRVLEAFLKEGGKRPAARALGINECTVRQALKRIERKGLAPWLSGAVTPDHLNVAKPLSSTDQMVRCNVNGNAFCQMQKQ